MLTKTSAFVLAISFFVFASSAIASPVKQYVLKHPKHEHCKSHYVKKTKTVKHRRETLCVYVAPKVTPTAPATSAPIVATPVSTTPVAPAPEVPTKPSGPLATTTTLSFGLPNCQILDNGIVDQCVYELSTSVTSTNGPVPSAFANLIFTNSGESWEIKEIGSLELMINIERFNGIKSTSLSNPIYGLIAEVPGEAAWKITATYGGSTGYSASQSETKSVT